MNSQIKMNQNFNFENAVIQLLFDLETEFFSICNIF